MSTLVNKESIKRLGKEIGIDWKTAKFSVEQFAAGVKIEMEHGSKDKQTDVTHNDPKKTAKIAWAHLKEIPDYYTRLKAMEKKAMKKSETVVQLKIALKERLSKFFGLQDKVTSDPINVQKALNNWRVRQAIRDILGKANVQEEPTVDEHTYMALSDVVTHHSSDAHMKTGRGLPTKFHWHSTGETPHKTVKLTADYGGDHKMEDFDVTSADKPKLFKHLQKRFPGAEHVDHEGFLTHP